MTKKTLEFAKITVANLDENVMKQSLGGTPLISRNPKKCETLIPLCVEETIVDCSPSGTPCLP